MINVLSCSVSEPPEPTRYRLYSKNNKKDVDAKTHSYHTNLLTTCSTLLNSDTNTTSFIDFSCFVTLFFTHNFVLAISLVSILVVGDENMSVLVLFDGMLLYANHCILIHCVVSMNCP